MSTIKSIRKRLGMTQAALAQAIDCTQGNIGHYEKGQSVPPEMARRIIATAQKAGLTVGYEDIYGPVDAQALAKPCGVATETVAQGG